MNEFFQQTLFSIAGRDISVETLLIATLIAIVWAIAQRIFVVRIFPKYLPEEEDAGDRRKLTLLSGAFFLTLILIAVSLSSGFDLAIVGPVQLSHILEALLLLQLARIADFSFNLIIQHRIEQREEEEGGEVELESKPSRREKLANRLVQGVVYVLLLWVILLRIPALDVSTGPIGGNGENKQPFSVQLSDVLELLLIILFARLLIWMFIHLFLYSYYKSRKVDKGNQFAINQLLKYVVITVAIFVGLNIIGLNLTILLGGAAALLVGVGLGLQQTFNDLFSGIVLLTERSVQVGDVVDIQGLIGTVKKIGLRTSEVITRENIVVVVPNSKLTVDNVVNWSHNDTKARFKVTVGVKYGSDTELVKNLLLKSARGHRRVLGYPAPFVWFRDFGESALIFELHFYSRELMRIEHVMSEIRFEIDRLFRENQVTIPFPQRDVWMKANEPEGNGPGGPKEPQNSQAGEAESRE